MMALFLLCSFINLTAFSQARFAKFLSLSTENGLAQGHVHDILKDSKGFMWFATNGGLNKYDGYKFTIYKHDPDRLESISNNIVSNIEEDDAGNLWVGTGSGVDKFDRAKEQFIHYDLGTKSYVNDIFIDSRKRVWVAKSDGLFISDELKKSFKHLKHNIKDTNSLSEDYVYKLTEDKNHEFWIATKNGLTRIDASLKQFTIYKQESHNKENLSSDWIKTVFTDSKGNIWIGTSSDGICLYNRKKNSFITYRHNSLNSNSLCHNSILSFSEDDKGNIWIGTENGGISVLDVSANKFTTLKNDPYDSYSLSNNSIYSIYMDDLKNMWVGTYSEGINFLSHNGDKFTHYNQNLTSRTGLTDHNILSLAGGKDGNLWIGTDGGGLNKFDLKTQTFTHYLNDAANANSISSNYVLSVVEMNDDIIALGLLNTGLDFFNKKTGKFTHHTPQKGNPKTLSAPTVTILEKGLDGGLWVGTWGKGLNFYDSKKNTFLHYENNPGDAGSISCNFTNCLLVDREGNLWTGSSEGLDKLNKTTNKFIHYRHSDNDKKSLSSNYVQSIFEDHAGNFWIGTSGGLNLFDKKNGTFTAYTQKDGLADDMIQSILEDKQNNLWLASNGGLTKFNPVTKTITNYHPSDGLQGSEFKANSRFKASDGQMFFGGTNGFNAFYPDSIKYNNFIPPVYLTSFQIFNQQVAPGGKDEPLQQQISEAKEITLSYKQSVFSFEFAALNYTLPEKNEYAYMLEGFDKSWNFSGTKRTATYTNLNAGKYIFKVKGSNNDGVWNEKGTSIQITILPPFWLTWWFKTLVVLTVIGAATALYGWRMSIIKGQKKLLEIKVKQQTTQLIKSNEEERKARREADEANRAKSVFLATMSHEIRTPMNGVIGMTSLLMQTDLNSEQKSYAKTITTCGETLLNVINGILDFSKIESGKMELENKPFDLKICIEEALEVFYSTLSLKKVKLHYLIDQNVPLQIKGDSLRLRQILINLVGNAIKFTVNGEIFIAVHLIATPAGAPVQLSFKVKDTGIGIPADKLERLFKAFSQVDSSTTRKHGGTGLGLVICDKLINLMGGSIQVASEFGKGTTFTFNILTETIEHSIPATLARQPGIYVETGEKEKQNNGQKPVTDFANKYPFRILVAEDNAINTIIIKKILSKLGYETTVAVNGLEVLDRVNESHYDMILMDVQMPEMDGLEATKKIRQNNKPQPLIIAMTANAMESDRNECIYAGMNDYMSKPINIDAVVNMLKKWGEGVKII